MFSAFWLKTWRDLWIYKKQSIAVIAAIAISSLTLGIILMSYTFLSRALEENYQLSSPSMLSYQLSGLYKDLKLENLSQHPNIERVALSRQIFGRIKNQQGVSFPLLLFVVPDFTNMQLDIVDLEDGHWPDTPGQIVIEKQALSLLQASLDETVNINTPSGLIGDARIVAIGHDVSVHQAEWENIVYGYVDAATLQLLGGKVGFDTIKVSINADIVVPAKSQISSIENNRRVGDNIRKWFSKQNIDVHNMHVASGEPPHSNITNGMFMIQIAFGVLCCLLSVILVVNLISAIISKQRRQIGIMKSLGARPYHIRKIYLQSTLTLCVIGVVFAVPVAWWLAITYANALAHMMNIEIFSYDVPVWVALVLFFTGCVVPLLTLMLPILTAANTSIKQTLMEYHDSATIHLPRWLTLLPQLPKFKPELRFAQRNIFRNKKRFMLNCMVLAFGGAILISGFNISKSMNLAIDRDRESRLWHSMVKFNKYMDKSVLTRSLSDDYLPFYQSAAKVVSASQVNMPDPTREPVTNGTENSPAIPRHDAIGLFQLDSPEKLLQPNMLQGKWLDTDDLDTDDLDIDDSNTLIDASFPPIVFSHRVSDIFPEFQIGNRVHLDNGTTYILVGVAEVFGRPVMYTTKNLNTSPKEQSFTAHSLQSDSLKVNSLQADSWETHHLKKASRPETDFQKLDSTKKTNGLFLTKPGLVPHAINAINRHQLKAINVVSADETAKVILDHFEIIFAMMMTLTLVTILIATNGTILTVSINIQERIREIAVLKAIGANHRSINVIVLGECLWSAILAWCIACLISIVVSYALSSWFGILLISTPLPPGINGIAMLFCLPALMLVALLAAYFPARQIMKLSIKEAIATG